MINTLYTGNVLSDLLGGSEEGGSEEGGQGEAKGEGGND